MIETLEVLNRSYDVQNHGFVNVSENDENQNEEEPVSSEKRAMDEEEDEKASNEVFWHFLLIISVCRKSHCLFPWNPMRDGCRRAPMSFVDILRSSPLLVNIKIEIYVVVQIHRVFFVIVFFVFDINILYSILLISGCFVLQN